MDLSMKLLSSIALSLFLLTSASQASAVVITFEGHSNTAYSSSITREGFDIGIVSGQTQHFHEISSTSFNLPNNGTGILLNDRDTQLFVEQSDGGTFTLDSVDVAASTGNGPSIGMVIEGFLNNVSTGVISIASLGAGYTHSLGDIFGNIDYLLFDGIGGQGGFVLDNLTLSGPAASVPEPGTLALSGLGLAGLALTRRSKKA